MRASHPLRYSLDANSSKPVGQSCPAILSALKFLLPEQFP